ncbi:MAG TPA: MgtC/SapB family protein [Candidatus Binatia bacterium]|nr:MgtC/SapB family protein [Candidatus Binatia bacterium]
MEYPNPGGMALGFAELALRFGIALLFGALVGIERRLRHKNAGIQTHALVSIGAAAFGVLSLLGFGQTNNPMLIAGAVVTGIGFIGGGVIMHRGGSVQGINTAATLWATASMGLAAGAGYYMLTAVVFGTMLIIQFPLRWLEHSIESHEQSDSAPPGAQ